MQISKIYGFNADGVNDYLRANSFNQVERTQAWTMSFLIRFGGSGSLLGTKYIASTRFITNTRGIAVRILDGTDIEVAITNSASNRLVKRFTFTSVASMLKMLHITYDGSSTAAGLKLYLDGVEITNVSTIASGLSATIINADNVFVLCHEQNILSCIMYNFLWVDAVKSTTEITNDSNARRGLRYSYTPYVDLSLNYRQGLSIVEASANAYTFNINGQTVGDWRPLRA